MILVIDGTIRHRITWDGTAEQLRAQAQQWITRGEFTILPLAAGGTVAVNWRAVRTLQVVKDFSAVGWPIDKAEADRVRATWERLGPIPPGTR